MRHLLLCAALLLTACTPWRTTPPPAAQEISGILRGTTRLHGDVLIVGDILVPVGSELIIAPGTVLRIRAAENTKIDPEYLSPATEILVRGALQVEGRASAPVSFVAEQPPASGEIAWAGIILDHAAPSSIRYSRIALAEQGLLVIASAPEIVGNELTGCRYGIVAQAASHPKILDNHLHRGEGGVFCWQGSNPYLKGNRLTDHAEEGIFVDASSRPWLDRNTVTGNAIGLALYARDLPYDATAIRGNREDVRFLGGTPP